MVKNIATSNTEANINISVQTEDFDQNLIYQTLQADVHSGAVVIFVGLVRDFDHATPTVGMELEHYPGMTENVLINIVNQAFEKWDIRCCELIHRVGKLGRNEQIVCVGLASSHRSDAFAATQFIMDLLKTQAPFWKKEILDSGEHWVKAKDSDSQALAKQLK